MEFSILETTHLGGRKNNQDYYAHKISENWACFVVADGLGGHDKGEVAAQYFCQSLMACVDDFAEKLPLDPIYEMEKLVQIAHQKMSQTILREYGVIDCHTTFVLLWLNEKSAITAHIGDSRFYRIDENNIIWRTPDHSMVQELFESGKVTEEAFATHPLQNRLTRTVNLFEVPRPDIFVHSPLEKKELMVLCSDGFWTHLAHEDWLALAKTQDKQEKMLTLVNKIVLAYPKTADNITVQLVFLKK